MKNEGLLFKKGTFKLHPDANFNFQMNRLVMWSGADLDELKEATRKITDLGSWVSTFLALGESALRDGRTEHAIAYFRGAEFFIYDDIDEKKRVGKRANSLFYDHYSRIFDEGIISRDRVPYAQGYLPIWIAKPDGDEVAGTIMLHGGYDSCMEEFLGAILYLRQKGYIVYLFDGPGQGEVLRRYGIPMTHEWERPVKPIVDHYDLDDVTIVGLSLGGMLAPRAAAFEPRIRRVVAWGVMPNFQEVVLSTRPQVLQLLSKVFLRPSFKLPINLSAKMEMAKDTMAEWGIKHGMYVFGVESPYDYLVTANRYQISDIAELITQDLLLLGSTKDHFIPRGFYKEVIDGLVNVKSLTFRLFNEREEAENHCNVGNTRLALDTIVDWIAGTSR
jgi:alpha-beta hydrolase superfamily lysophospholipase